MLLERLRHGVSTMLSLSAYLPAESPRRSHVFEPQLRTSAGRTAGHVLCDCGAMGILACSQRSSLAEGAEHESRPRFIRSEERRVGKECRSGCGQDHVKKKDTGRRE